MRHKQNMLVRAQISAFARSSLMASERGEQHGGRARELPMKGKEIRLSEEEAFRQIAVSLHGLFSEAARTKGSVGSAKKCFTSFCRAASRQALKILGSSWERCSSLPGKWRRGMFLVSFLGHFWSCNLLTVLLIHRSSKLQHFFSG